MGYKIPQIAGNSNAISASNPYITCVNSELTQANTEAWVQFYVTKPGKFSGLSVSVAGANASGTSTFTFRKNGSDGAQSLTIPSGTTGIFSDTTNEDAVAVGDLINVRVSYSAGTITPSSVTIFFEAYDGTSTSFLMSASGSASLTAANLTRYVGPNGPLPTNLGTEHIAQNILNHDCTISDFGVYISANARATNTTFRVRKNGANTSLTAVVGGGVTGLVQSGNSDSLAVSDLFNYQFVTSTGSQNITIRNIQSTLTSDKADEITILANASFVRSSTAANIWGKVAGTLGVNTGTEVTQRVYLGLECEVSRFSLYVSINASNRDMDIYLRAGSADTNNVIANARGVTGWQQDTANVQSIFPNNQLAFRSINTGTSGSGNVTYTATSFLVKLPPLPTAFRPQIIWW